MLSRPTPAALVVALVIVAAVVLALTGRVDGVAALTVVAGAVGLVLPAPELRRTPPNDDQLDDDQTGDR